MPSDPDPRKLISREFFQTCLYAYQEQGHLLNDADSIILHIVIQAFPKQRRVNRSTFYKAKEILRDLHNHS